MKLSFPVEIDEGLYSSDVNSNDPFILQTCRVKWKSEDINTIYLENDHDNKKIDKFFDNIRDVESTVCEAVSKKSEKWFGVHLDIKKLKDMFQTSLRLPSNYSSSFQLHVDTVSDNLQLYDQKNRKKTIDDVENNEVTCLLQVKKIYITEVSLSIHWELLQIMIHKKKKPIIMGSISIQDESDEPEKPLKLFKSKEEKITDNDDTIKDDEENCNKDEQPEIVEEVIEDSGEAKLKITLED